MLFNSLHFFLFFVFVLAVYFRLGARGKQYLIFIASSYFYAVFIPKYLLILYSVILIDFTCGHLIQEREGRKRKGLLLISLIANASILFFFKYYDFTATNLNFVASILGLPALLPLASLILPIGLSFHTFQAVSYTIEVYRQRVPAETDLLIYANYVLFFPQLVAGPIERPQNLMHQFHSEHKLDVKGFLSGFELLVWGLFKKCVIADRLAVYTDQIFDHPGKQIAMGLWIGVYSFAIQIYCDFSGYSDIARGAARMLGYDLMINFKQPYWATNIQDFWRRWHISLSTWFRDYVYIPLGGSRTNGRIRNILIVFLLSGLWHGANWTFAVWGIYHGVLVAGHRVLVKARLSSTFLSFQGTSLFQTLARIITFNSVAFGWIFFRANNLKESWVIIRGLSPGQWFAWEDFVHEVSLVTSALKIEVFDILVLLIALSLMSFVHYLQEHKLVETVLRPKSLWFRTSLLYGLILSVLLLGRFGERQFIYFQF